MYFFLKIDKIIAPIIATDETNKFTLIIKTEDYFECSDPLIIDKKFYIHKDFLNNVFETHLAKMIDRDLNQIEEFKIGEIKNNSLKIIIPQKEQETQGQYKNDFIANYDKCLNIKKESFTKKFNITKTYSEDLMLNPISYNENIDNFKINWFVFKDKATLSLNNEVIANFKLEKISNEKLKAQKTNFPNIYYWNIKDEKTNNINHLVVNLEDKKYYFIVEKDNGYYAQEEQKTYPKKIEGDDAKVKIQNGNELTEIDFRKITDSLNLEKDLVPYLKIYGISFDFNEIYLTLEIKKDNEVKNKIMLSHNLETGVIDKSLIPISVIEFK